MAWWRERLEDLDRGTEPPAEPHLQAVSATLIPAGISGTELSQLEDCWVALLSPFPWDDLVGDALAERGRILFGIGARLLGREALEGEPYGVVWSLVDGAQHCSDPESRAYLENRARSAVPKLPQRSPPDLLPITMFVFRRTYELLHGDRYGWHRLLWAIRSLISGGIPRS